MATKKATTTKKKAPAKASKTSVKTVPASAKKTASLGQQVVATLRTVGWWRALSAEFIGTFLLASIIVVGQGQPIFVLFGLVGIVLLVGAITGAHVNPAMTIGAWATRRIGWLRAVGYIVAQLLGAAVAYFTLTAFLAGSPVPTAEQAAFGQTAQTLFHATNLETIVTNGTVWFVFFAEMLGAAILGFAISSSIKNKDRLTAAFTAGLGIFIALMVSFTVAGFVGAGTILNPAVAISLQAYDLSLWTYAVWALAPILGGIVGFVIRDLVDGREA